ncbi:MAG: ABC transporter ATP-binding protein [Eubacteriales bacterium]
MISMMKYIRQLAGNDVRRLISPVILSIIDSLLNSSMYGVMIFAFIGLATGTFTLNVLRTYSLIMITVFFARLIIHGIGYTQAQCRGPEISKKLRLQIGNHIRSLNLGFFNKNSIGRLNSTLATDVSDFETIITHCLCDFVKVTVFTIISLIISLAIDWRYGLILGIIIIVAFPLLSLSGKISARNSKKLRTSSQNVVSMIVEYINGIKTFRLYNLTGERFERLDNSLSILKKESTHAELSILPYTMSFSTITSFIVPMSLIIGTYLLTQQNMHSTNFLVILLLSISISSTMSSLSSLYPQVRSLTKASENMLSILSEEPFPYKKDRADFYRYNLSFDNVSFQYTDNVDVLKNISFTADNSTTTALIGPSGSGKTTIVSLISRFWDVSSGSITIDGEDIRQFAPDALTEHMAVVFQDVYLLNDTVLNNIMVGKTDATKEEVITAAKEAHCHNFITEMENGYDTMIGEGGSTLSGGEKQRISIARALLKDAPIVLLDETTSSLDADNETEIQHAFDRLMKNKTVLVIAHRLGTIVNAHNILVLDKGEIIESGNHKTLLEKKGWYAQMFEEQKKAQEWTVHNNVQLKKEYE